MRRQVYFEVKPSRAVEAGTKIHQLLELMPEEADEEWSAEDMEEAEDEVQTILDEYFGTHGRG